MCVQRVLMSKHCHGYPCSPSHASCTHCWWFFWSPQHILPCNLHCTNWGTSHPTVWQWTQMNTDHILDILSGTLDKQKSHLPPTCQLWKELWWEAVNEGHRSYDPKAPCTSHPDSYPLCLKKSMWLIIQGNGMLTSRQWLQINDTHTRMVV